MSSRHARDPAQQQLLDLACRETVDLVWDWNRRRLQPSDAGDVTSETYVVLHQNVDLLLLLEEVPFTAGSRFALRRKSGIWTRPLLPWLYRVSYNKQKQHFGILADAPEALGDVERVLAPSASVVDEVAIREDYQNLLKQLSDEERELIDAIVMTNLTTSEIGFIFGVTGNAIRVRIHTLRHRIAVLIARLHPALQDILERMDWLTRN